MKKIVVSLVFLLVCVSAFSRTAYCELLGTAANLSGTKVKVQVDFGEVKNSWGNDGRDFLVDASGNDIKFNSMVDAMNYMSQFGWECVQTYVVTVGGSNVIHWLLAKEIENESQIRQGIQQRRDVDKK